jgi:broad specificity phosphatase PhoE
MKLWTEDPATAVMPQGECLQDVQDRAWQTVMEIQDLHPEESVALVSHNFTIQTLICRVLGMPLANFQRLQVGLGSITVVASHRNRTTLIKYNDRCHLESL